MHDRGVCKHFGHLYRPYTFNGEPAARCAHCGLIRKGGEQ